MNKKEIITIREYNSKYVFFSHSNMKIAPYKINKINRSILKIKIGLKIKVDIIGKNIKNEKKISLKNFLNKSINNKLKENKKKKKNIFGIVVKETKGGYVVIYKNIICFTPKKFFRNKPLDLIGKKFYFKVNKIKKKNLIILSRDKFFIKERKKQINKILRKKNMLKVFPIKIVAITKYGVFSKYKKIIGLIKIRKFLIRENKIKVGNYVFAKVQRYNNKNDRILFLKVENIPFMNFFPIKKEIIKNKYLIFKKKEKCYIIFDKINKIFEKIKRRQNLKKKKKKNIIVIKKPIKKDNYIKHIKNRYLERKKNYVENKTNIYKIYKKFKKISFICLPFRVFAVINYI